MSTGAKKLPRLQSWGVACTALVAVCDLTGLVFKGLSGGDNPVPAANFGVILFLAQFIVFMVAAMAMLATQIKNNRGMRQQQYIYMLLGILPSLLFSPLTSFIMPVVFRNASLVFLSPVYGAFFVGMIGYAIVKHQLFDIRSFVLRAVAYLFSTVLLSITFIVPAVLIVAAIIHIQFTWGRFVWGIGVATLFALAYNRVRATFDNLTNRIFFRGYYDPQDIFNRLSEVLVHSIEVEYIKQQSARILQDAIKTRRLEYWLVEDPGYATRQPTVLGRLFRHPNASNVVITDELADASSSATHLRNEDVAALVRLRTGSTVLGFMALGFKESGETYTARDRQLLNIASDEIAIALQNALHFQEIKHFNQTLQGKVAQATNELRHSNEKLKVLDETKDEFITMASHQLRTPLTSVKGYLSMVLEGDAGPLNANQTKLLNQSYMSAQRMVYLIADLLNLSRLSTGKFVIEPKPVDLPQIVDDEVEQLVETAKSRGVILTYHKPASFPELLLDETKIRQVIMNFIDNAIYYTPSGGEITVELRETPSSVEYLVRDNGIGVPRREQHRLFTKFYRAENARQARPDGTGLGLFMAKKVIIAQGGSIIFDSVEGKGSTFGFRFSKSRHAVPAVPVAKLP
jgi:signal transduction histidine kinase